MSDTDPKAIITQALADFDTFVSGLPKDNSVAIQTSTQISSQVHLIANQMLSQIDQIEKQVELQKTQMVIQIQNQIHAMKNQLQNMVNQYNNIPKLPVTTCPQSSSAMPTTIVSPVA